MISVYEAIADIRENATSEKDKGTRFERMSRYYLKNDPLWSGRFSDVYMWQDSPTNTGVDIGIDLVAKDAEDGTYWAIQCKCFDDDATLHYGEVATFFGTTGNQGNYAHTMIISSAGRYSNHLDTVADQWETIRVFTDDMAASELDFEPWLLGKNAVQRVYQEAREHQKLAIEDCIKGFDTHDRGQLIMACGTGKTLTSLRLAEELLRKDNKKADLYCSSHRR